MNRLVELGGMRTNLLHGLPERSHTLLGGKTRCLPDLSAWLVQRSVISAYTGSRILISRDRAQLRYAMLNLKTTRITCAHQEAH
jgi:hypothetical protein